MYIRRKKSPNSPRQSIQIVEGYRDSKGNVKQRIVRHLGVFVDEVEEAKLVALAQDLIAKIKAEREAATGQGNLFTDDTNKVKRGRPTNKQLKDILPVNEVKLNEVVEVKRVVEGVHQIGGHVYDQMHFNQLLARKRDAGMLKDLVLARMVRPNSKKGIVEYLSDQFDQHHDLDATYWMMDKLHEQIPKIKELCFKNTLTLIPNKEISLVFFDVTTLYFESVEIDELRAFGYSKDHRFNTTQLVLALATNEDGLPLGYELFSGNTAEVSTLIKSINSWQAYLKVKDVCFIADRAMFSKANLQALDEGGYRYIVAAKLKTLKKEKKEEILSEENYKPTVIGNDLTWIADLEHDGKRLITSYKSKRAINDAQERQKILDKINKTIGESGSTKKLISNSGVKKYTSSENGKSYIDAEKIEQDALWDGMHGVITNDQTITPHEAIAKYARLWVIEEQFRINKHNLQMRPIFHWTKQRIEAHIAVCYMSFAVLKTIEYKVALTQKISVTNIVELLISVQASISRHTKTGDLYRLPSAIKNEARKIYKTFNIKRSDHAAIYLK
ncbi:IS1634 family transposase [Candidatus Tisiphia endosymbiont of Oplodontha viridula]|uniref:IS1634 family transposase n=1 Tax=Candidatus Tisiphia endosymbiont of Oplodontha viridula TaxID=3077925 RepID=UPI0035C8AACE